MRGNQAEPVRAGELARLFRPFPPAEPEMGIEAMENAKGRIDRHPERTARLPAIPGAGAGELGRVPDFKRQPADDGIAVMLVAHAHGRVESAVPAEFRGNQGGLINAGTAFPVQVELLQADDVRAERGNDLGDPLLRPPAVGADATVDVVGDDAKARRVRGHGYS